MKWQLCFVLLCISYKNINSTLINGIWQQRCFLKKKVTMALSITSKSFKKNSLSFKGLLFF